MAAAASLTAQQREQVAMFQSVTNEPSESQAISLLQSCNWNMETAVATAFAISSAAGTTSPPTQPTTSSARAPPAQSTVTTGSTSASSFMNNSRPTSASAAAAGTSSRAASASASPPAPSTSASPPTPQKSGWFSGIKKIFSGSKSSNGASSSSASSSAPRTPQEAFLHDFAQTYGPHVPNFVTGSYNDAVREAKAKGRMLFLYLHASTHDDTEIFVRETLATEAMCNFLRENFVSWAGTIKHTPTYQLCQTFGVTTFPFVAALAPQQAVNSVAVVYRNSGLIDADSLMRELLHRMEMHNQISSHMEATRVAEQAEREQARSLREQQDAEYAESLLMDQGLKEAQEREAREMEEMLRLSREAEAAAEAERQRQAQIEAERQAQLEAERIALLASLPEEPAATAPGAVNIAFRLPNAKKAQRRFLDTQTIGTVHRYLHTLEDMAPIGDKYRILSNFPRKVHEDPQATLASLKLGKQIQLIVESTEDEEEEAPTASS